MRRALFAREFRSALVPNLVTVGAILATLVLLERLRGLPLGKAEDVRVFTDVALLAGLVMSGFISGERCFPAEMKESRMIFLSSLPIPRSWAWLMIVSARLLAALASLSFVCVVRRPLLTFLISGSPGEWDLGLVVARVLFAYVFFFSAGVLFALLFRRTLFSYVAGFIIVGILLIETILSVAYSMALPKLADLSTSYIFFFEGPSLRKIEAPLSVFLAMSFFLSWRFFVSGEIASPKQRIRNQMLLGVFATAFLGFVFCVESSQELASVRSTWTSALPESQVGQPLFHGVSPDGRYLSVVEALQGRPFIRRITLIDTGSGRVVGRHIHAGVGWFFWASHSDVLNLLALNNSPLDRWGYLVPGTVDWIRLSPEAREISKLRLKGLEEIKTLGEGRALAVLRQDSQGRVLLLDGASGRPSELVRAPLDGNVVVHEDKAATLVYFDNVLLPRRAWIIDSRARELQIPRSLRQKISYVLFGEVFESSAEAETALRRRFPPPSTQKGTPMRGGFYLPPQLEPWILSAADVKGLYFMEQGEPNAFWARSTSPEGEWQRLPILASLRRPVGAFSRIPPLIDAASGIGTFLTEDNNGRFFLYVPRIGVIRESRGCERQSRAYLDVYRLPGLTGLLIKLACEDFASIRERVYYFEYLPGSPELRSIKTAVDRPANAPLYLDERGREVWTTLDGDVWSSAPGRKDLHLWPLPGMGRQVLVRQDGDAQLWE